MTWTTFIRSKNHTTTPHTCCIHHPAASQENQYPGNILSCQQFSLHSLQFSSCRDLNFLAIYADNCHRIAVYLCILGSNARIIWFSIEITNYITYYSSQKSSISFKGFSGFCRVSKPNDVIGDGLLGVLYQDKCGALSVLLLSFFIWIKRKWAILVRIKLNESII